MIKMEDEVQSSLQILERALALFMERSGQMELWQTCVQEVEGNQLAHPGNAISVIYPYLDHGMWVFDDTAVDLVKEPFVAGADRMIEEALRLKGINNAEVGFRLLFSAYAFPDVDFCLNWLREEDDGNVYGSEELDMEGWLCPALLKYFTEPPQRIYLQMKALHG
jgi:hypothetical protein